MAVGQQLPGHPSVIVDKMMQSGAGPHAWFVQPTEPMSVYCVMVGQAGRVYVLTGQVLETALRMRLVIIISSVGEED